MEDLLELLKANPDGVWGKFTEPSLEYKDYVFIQLMPDGNIRYKYFIKG